LQETNIEASLNAETPAVVLFIHRFHRPDWRMNPASGLSRFDIINWLAPWGRLTCVRIFDCGAQSAKISSLGFL
jgi:hypothetical protein